MPNIASPFRTTYHIPDLEEPPKSDILFPRGPQNGPPRDSKRVLVLCFDDMVGTKFGEVSVDLSLSLDWLANSPFSKYANVNFPEDPTHFLLGIKHRPILSRSQKKGAQQRTSRVLSGSSAAALPTANPFSTSARYWYVNLEP